MIRERVIWSGDGLIFLWSVLFGDDDLEGSRKEG